MRIHGLLGLLLFVGLVMGLMLDLPWACCPLIFFENLWDCLLFCYHFFFLGLKVEQIYIFFIKGVPNLMEGVPNFFF